MILQETQNANADALAMNERELAAFTRGFRETADAMRSAQGAARAASKSLRALTGNLPRSTTLEALVALNILGKHVYAGTVPGVVVDRRRAANRRARAQRRTNRRRNFRKGVR